jgi:hypothetical protein
LGIPCANNIVPPKPILSMSKEISIFMDQIVNSLSFQNQSIDARTFIMCSVRVEK